MAEASAELPDDLIQKQKECQAQSHEPNGKKSINPEEETQWNAIKKMNYSDTFKYCALASFLFALVPTQRIHIVRTITEAFAIAIIDKMLSSQKK